MVSLSWKIPYIKMDDLGVPPFAQYFAVIEWLESLSNAT